uniref:RING-type domain-containing protein n=1 Tax=Ditylenchus dipsaci TaxID=166011 RepID=A0A915D8H0_9BILA
MNSEHDDDNSSDPTQILFDGTTTPSSEHDSDQFSLASDTLFNINNDGNSDSEHSLDGVDDALSIHSSTPASTTTEELLPTPTRRILPPRRAAARPVASHSPLQRRHALRRISSDSGTSRSTFALRSSTSRQVTPSSNSASSNHGYLLRSSSTVSATSSTITNRAAEPIQRATRGRATRQVAAPSGRARACRGATDASQMITPNLQVLVTRLRGLSSSSEGSPNQSPSRRRMPLRRSTAIRRSRGQTPYSLHSNSPPSSGVHRIRSNTRNRARNTRISSSMSVERLGTDDVSSSRAAETETSGTFSNEENGPIGVVYECITLRATQQVIPRRMSVEAVNAQSRNLGRRIVSTTSGDEDDGQTNASITVVNHTAPRRQTTLNSTIMISPDGSSSSDDSDNEDNEVQVILTRAASNNNQPSNLQANNPARARRCRGRGWVRVAYVAGGAAETPGSYRLRQIEEDRLIAERFAREAARSRQDCSIVEAINGPSPKKKARISDEVNKPGTSGINATSGASVGSCTICMEDLALKPVGCLYCRQLIGCEKCVRKWFRTNNISHLNRYSPLSMGSSNLNHRSCPLCRVEWEDVPEIAPYPLA